MFGLAKCWNKPTPPVIAVVEDDETERILLSARLRSWGYAPEIFTGSYNDIPSLLREVKARASDFVICDNHLQQAGYARFDGAEAVAELIKCGLPSILVTQHQDSDVMRLKRWRPLLPVILDKPSITQESMAIAFDKCVAEVRDGIFAQDRRHYRVLVEIDAIYDNDVIAFVDAWNPHESVSFPRNLLDHLPSPHIQAGALLLAEVNIGASNRRDLFFENFQLAPEPDPNDSLA